ncbi:hypothetical protein GGI13_003665 [Coemansia sp. RSA 455]|nr:hypothetical protein GGI13_003665 [Coemansia sp. RSA 455]
MSTTYSSQLDEYREQHEHPQVVADRHTKLANALEGLGTSLNFPELLRQLGLESAHRDYETATGDIFDNIASYVPTIGSASLGERSGDEALESKKTYVKKLMDVVQLMRGQAAEAGALPKHYARMPYNVLDRMDHFVDDEPFPQLDVSFVFNGQGEMTFSDVYIALKAEECANGPDAYRKHIGELADYALALWKRQPTRTFIPVLFLHGHQLDLLVFTRRGYFWTGVGPVLFTDHCVDRDILSAKIGLSLRCLWFLPTLPAGKLGFLFDFYFDSWATPCRLRIDASTFPATVEETRDSDGTVVFVKELIKRPVQITGRCSYLFNAKYGDEEVVLKLAWTCTHRLPEGAVYRVLEARGVPIIPKIYKSGVIIKDFDGYCLEVLVLEHCGTPIVEHILRMPKDPLSISRVDRLVKDSIRGVLETLTEALAADILHRDISPGNIAIKDETAYVIDWGCAKLLHPPSDLDLRAKISEHWSFDWDKVLATENGKDSSTGTPLYMSTRLLLKARTRSIYDDLESLLYVILDALSDRPRTGKPDLQPLGFRFYDSSNMAMTRLMCTHSSLLFLDYFGVNLRNESTLDDVLDAMRRFLFFDNGEHLGARILHREDISRNFADSAVRVFMSDTTAHEFMLRVGQQKEKQSPLTVETATTALSTQRPARSSKLVSKPPLPPVLVHSAERDALGDDDVDVGGGSITARTSNSDAVPGSLSSSRSGLLSTRSVPNFARQSESSSSTRSARTAISASTAHAAPSRIPACPTTSRASAISDNSTNVKASDDKRPNDWQMQTRSRSNALAKQSSNLTKESVGTVGKTKSKRGKLSKGVNKRVSDDKDEQEFPNLIEKLGLGDKYAVYSTRADGAFSNLAEGLPVLKPASSTSTHPLEKVHVAGFRAMLKKLPDAAKASLVPEYAKLLFVVLDGQSKSFHTTKDLRPDLFVFEEDTESLSFDSAHILFEAKCQMSKEEVCSEYLGQVAQYALTLMAVKPMRRYIPMFFLYGCQLDLLVFTNSGYYKTNIGPVLYNNADFKLTETDLVTERPFIDSSPCVIIAPTTTYLTI